jgi:hypothetical protein
VWGSITEQSNFIHNPELRRFSVLLNSSEVGADLNSEATLFGASWMAQQLKMRRQQDANSAEAAETSRNDNQHVLSDVSYLF